MEFRALPVEPDEGFPQRFSVAVGERTYDVSLYARIAPAPDDPLDRVYDLAPPAAGFLVLRLDRRGPEGARTILLRKLVVDPTLVHEAEELAVVVREARIARGNLNAPGRLGSRIVIGVAERWA